MQVNKFDKVLLNNGLIVTVDVVNKNRFGEMLSVYVRMSCGKIISIDPFEIAGVIVNRKRDIHNPKFNVGSYVRLSRRMRYKFDPHVYEAVRSKQVFKITHVFLVRGGILGNIEYCYKLDGVDGVFMERELTNSNITSHMIYVKTIEII